MRRNGFNGGSFLIGLLIGLVILLFVIFAIYGANNRTATTVYTYNTTATPAFEGTQPAIPVTGPVESPNPFRTAVDYFLQQVNQKIFQPFVSWLNGKPIVIQTNSDSTPLATPTP